MYLSVRKLVLVWFLEIVWLAVWPSSAQILGVEYANVAKGKKIVTSATCGEDSPYEDIYCGVEGAYTLNGTLVVQKQFWDVCDSKKPDKKHPAEFMLDEKDTWWQSPSLSRGLKYNEVNITIDLEQEYYVTVVTIRMGNSAMPAVGALERSDDYGETYTPWQYFANTVEECASYFGNTFHSRIIADDSVTCETLGPKIMKLKESKIVVSLVKGRPSEKNYLKSATLREWTRATNIRFRLLKITRVLENFAFIPIMYPLTRYYYYSIKDISVSGRPYGCNGHKVRDTLIDEVDPKKHSCECEDNTCGSHCEYCCPGFEQRKRIRSKDNEKLVCEKCNCFGHTDQCEYNETVAQLSLSLDIHGNYGSGGFCQNCQHFTEGINCNKCIRGYFRPHGKLLNDADVCQPCQCNYTYSTGNCQDGDGQCECKDEYTKPNCDSCSFGYYGFPWCKACECYLNGTSSLQCNPAVNGSCVCRENFSGELCRSCADGYHHFPECKVCNCEMKGTLPQVCDKTNGQCFCKPGYSGPRCNQCAANYTAFPDCRPCNCSSIGSAFSVCDNVGKCTCLANITGRRCDQCYPGYFKFPKCLPCSCYAKGTSGLLCSNRGECRCRHNFAGDKCDRCRFGFYNFPVCEECNFDPAGVLPEFSECDKPEAEVKCKANVQGKICGKCKDLYWNLTLANPNGCEDCGCNRNGTLSRLGICDSTSGRCVCKELTTSRKCDVCADGFYNLEEDNLFGCVDCECDIGGSVNNTCDKNTGQCFCLPGISGRTCKEPLTGYHFPTLYQYQYEVEDGHTLALSSVRNGFDESVFPGYSWRGYAVFSVLKNETIHEVTIEKASAYRMVLRYINLNSQAIISVVSVSPQVMSHLDSEQKFPVLFKPSKTPAFATVAKISESNTSPFVLNPGQWIIKLKIEKSLLLDYFVLIPAEYYEGNLLASANIITPCTIDTATLCRLYRYPDVTPFSVVRGIDVYRPVYDEARESEVEALEYMTDFQEFGISEIPILNALKEFYINLKASPKPHVLIVAYVTSLIQETSSITFHLNSKKNDNNGTATLYPCRYRTACKQVVTDESGNPVIFQFENVEVTLTLKVSGEGIGLESVVAIPLDAWSLDYVKSKPSCVMDDNKCVPSSYISPLGSRRFNFKSGNGNRISKVLPSTIYDNTAELVHLTMDYRVANVSGKVPFPGLYVFIVHYYQPDLPEFSLDVIVQSGESHEAKITAQHCPSNSGCRSVITQENENMDFMVHENFQIAIREDYGKSIWLHYILVIPSNLINGNILVEEPFDQSPMFRSKCGTNHFYLDNSAEDYCKETTFSLTTNYNGGALPCNCDAQGSANLECAKFGGKCSCRDNIIGRRCNMCKTGYFGFPACKPCNCSSVAVCDPTTGDCLCPRNVVGEKCDMCKPFTYGFDPVSGCKECNCIPHGVVNGNMQCDLVTGFCKCKKNIRGRKCGKCVTGTSFFPECTQCKCDYRGTTEDVCNQMNGVCYCKSNVRGPICDTCKEGTFNLQSDNPSGCTKCFCFGKTASCSNSGLFISMVSSLDDWKLANASKANILELNTLPLELEKESNGVSVNMSYVSDDVVYFMAPEAYLGNKLTAYGGFLNYTVYYSEVEEGKKIQIPNVILQNDTSYLVYTLAKQPAADSHLQVSVRFVERSFTTPSGSAVSHEDIMRMLQDLSAIYIRATYVYKGDVTKLLNVSLDIATLNNDSSLVAPRFVENCDCPPNYTGTSCEECADGYYRGESSDGFSDEEDCIPCKCNGDPTSTTCDKVTGMCIFQSIENHTERVFRPKINEASVLTPNDYIGISIILLIITVILVGIVFIKVVWNFYWAKPEYKDSPYSHALWTKEEESEIF